MSAGGTPLLRVVVHEPDWAPSLMTLCAGYELEAWRIDALARQVSDWLPSFVLPWSEQQTPLGSDSTVELLRKAAEAVYKTDKYSRRGEFGELILHGVLRQHFGTEMAVSKLWFKDSHNDTVKGFDVVHVGEDPDSDDLHLWLGEAKFYGNFRDAVRLALADVKSDLTSNYLRGEFMFVSNKIDPLAPYADRLRRLIHENTPLAEVFGVLHIPVLVTYDSPAVAAHTSHCDEYVAAVRAEVEPQWTYFRDNLGDVGEVVIHLIFIPLEDKQALATKLDERLKAWQAI